MATLIKRALDEPIPFGDVADDLEENAAGPIYAAVGDAAGVRYRTDEFNHRVIVETPGGELRFIGGPGSGPGEFRYPRGLAILPADCPANGRLYICDAWNHRIQVLDLDGRPVAAFGSVGSAEGQFDVPSDVTLIAPRFPGEDLAEGSTAGLMLAVADRWNSRVQIFSLDGAFIAAVGAPEPYGPGRERRPGFTRDGWPFFRLGSQPSIFFPTRLAWRAPLLDVACANGHVIRIDLALALLPDFDGWRRGASLAEVRAARIFLRRGRRGASLPADVAARLDTELGRRLLADGRIGAAARLWKTRWPPHLGGARIEQQLAERLAILQPLLERYPGEPSAALRALTTKIADERRRRGRAAARQFLTWRRQASRPGAARGGRAGFVKGRFEEAALRLDRIRDLDASARSFTSASTPQGVIVWTAPTGDRRLQHIAVSGSELAVASSDGRALWIGGREPFETGRAPVPLARVSLALALAPLGLAAHPHGGWIVGDEAGDRLFHVRPDRVVSSIPLSQASHARLRGPNGLASADELIYVADRDRDRVQVFDLTGRAIGGYPRLDAPGAVAIDGEFLWVAELGKGSVRKLRRDTGEPILNLAHPELFAPGQLAATSSGLLVADTIGGGVHAFAKTGEWRGIVRHPGRVSGLALLNEHAAIKADQQQGALVRFDISEDQSWEQ